MSAPAPARRLIAAGKKTGRGPLVIVRLQPAAPQAPATQAR